MCSLTPLSNDPEVMLGYINSLGFELKDAQLSEVFSFDDEMLDFVPKPVYGVIFLYPIDDSDGVLESRHLHDKVYNGEKPFYTHQTVGNACGTIALIHVLMNNLDHVTVKDGSCASKLVRDLPHDDPDGAAKLIEADEELLEAHEDFATNDDAEIPECVMNHFIAFIEFNGDLWELDGRKDNAINHGKCSDLLKDSISVVKTDFLPHLTNSNEISMTVLCKQLAV